jgi:hypothetical protein
MEWSNTRIGDRVDLGADAGLRGSDFPSVGEYKRWAREVIEREHNALHGEFSRVTSGHSNAFF